MGLVSTQNNGLKILEDAAAREDVTAFGRAEETMEWTRYPPEDFIRAINLALRIGTLAVARRIAEKGARLYPNHEDVQLHARVLAPPKVLRTDLPADPKAEADIAWLKQHATEYRGKWVALKDGELKDSADSFEQLFARLDDRAGVLLTRIP